MRAEEEGVYYQTLAVLLDKGSIQWGGCHPDPLVHKAGAQSTSI